MKNLIRRVLKEITETEPLNWRLPKKFVDQLGIKLYDENDRAYIVEIHFDTRNVIVELFTEFNGEYESYWVVPQVPKIIKGFYSFPIDELPQDVKTFIIRRLDFKYIEYL
jgi:hypothetical protein